MFFLQKLDYDKIIIREKVSKIIFINENKNEFLSNCLDIDHHLGVIKSHLNYPNMKEDINAEYTKCNVF